MSRTVEKITVDMHAERLAQDLERYVQKALDLGATRAAVLKADDIPVDERVTLKCQIPRCFGYGVGAHCPPNTLKPAELRDILKNTTGPCSSPWTWTRGSSSGTRPPSRSGWPPTRRSSRW